MFFVVGNKLRNMCFGVGLQVKCCSQQIETPSKEIRKMLEERKLIVLFAFSRITLTETSV